MAAPSRALLTAGSSAPLRVHFLNNHECNPPLPALLCVAAGQQGGCGRGSDAGPAGLRGHLQQHQLLHRAQVSRLWHARKVASRARGALLMAVAGWVILSARTWTFTPPCMVHLRGLGAACALSSAVSLALPPAAAGARCGRPARGTSCAASPGRGCSRCASSTASPAVRRTSTSRRRVGACVCMYGMYMYVRA